jgi:hypothetical protein
MQDTLTDHAVALLLHDATPFTSEDPYTTSEDAIHADQLPD